MEYLLTSEEMKQCDHYTISTLGIPSAVLMERAALGTLSVLLSGEFDLSRILIVCGDGNNGGDGVALARLLYFAGYSVTILRTGKKIGSQGLMEQIAIAEKCHVPIEAKTDLQQYTTIVDAIFGIGLSRAVTGENAQVIDEINQSPAKVLAIDIPSGISADNGQILGIAVKATTTVTFAYKKRGMVLYPAVEYCGNIIVKDIGIPTIALAEQRPQTYCYHLDDLQRLPKRKRYSNKGTFGKTLVIAGSYGMSGAAYFSALAAYRTGCGLVRIFTPECNRQILQTQLPEALLTVYDEHHLEVSQLSQAIQWSSVVVIGPGLGLTDSARMILTEVLKQPIRPIIIDADALTLLAQQAEWLIPPTSVPIIITPHLGEMARLVKQDIATVAEQLLPCAQQYAQQHKLICVLKDSRTVVCSGDQIYINVSGNNGMATGGSGDVLTGVIAGLIAQEVPVVQAVESAVFLHGLAGDKALIKKGAYSMIAEDIIQHLAEVMCNI